MGELKEALGDSDTLSHNSGELLSSPGLRSWGGSVVKNDSDINATKSQQ